MRGRPAPPLGLGARCGPALPHARARHSSYAPVLDRQLDGDAQALPVLGALGDVVTDLLGRQTQGTNLGGKGRRGTDLATYGTQVHCCVEGRGGEGDGGRADCRK